MLLDFLTDSGTGAMSAKQWSAIMEGDGSCANDCRGEAPFYPIVNGKTLKTLQVPTTLPTLDELLSLDGRTPRQVNEEVWAMVKEDALNVYALHTEVEGGALFETFDALLGGLRDRGIVARTHADWLPELKAANPPAKAMARREGPGRAGWLSFEP